MPKQLNGKGKKREELKRNFDQGRRGTSVLYLVLVTVVIGVLVRQVFARNYENCFTCLLTLLLFLVPTFVERKLRISLPNTLEVIIILFIFSAEILGEISAFYIRFSWWDDLLHTLNGFLMAAIGVSLVDILNQNEIFKFKLSPFFVALVGFCFSMTIGVIWEFFEFFMDYFMKTDMQKDAVLKAISSVTLHPMHENVPIVVDGIEEVILQGEHMSVNGVSVQTYPMKLSGYLDLGLLDTMKDLFVNFIGAVVFSVSGYFYIKTREKGEWIRGLIPRKKQQENE